MSESNPFDATIPPGQVTLLLQDVNRGDKKAVDKLFALMYDQLKRTAQCVKWGPSSGTSLVNEAYVRMVGATGLSLEDRKHFYHYAAEAMRRVLVDQYRADHAERRGGKHKRVDGLEIDAIAVEKTDWLALDSALEDLKREHERQYEVVMLHFFAGWEFQEIAKMLGKDPKTIQRDWQAARAFLLMQLNDDSEE